MHFSDEFMHISCLLKCQVYVFRWIILCFFLLFGDGFHNNIHIPFYFFSCAFFFTIETIWCVIISFHCCMHKKHLVREHKKNVKKKKKREKSKRKKKMVNTSKLEFMFLCMVKVPQSLRQRRHQQKQSLSFGVVWWCACVRVFCIFVFVSLCGAMSSYFFFFLYIGMKRWLCQFHNKIAYGDRYRCDSSSAP